MLVAIPNVLCAILLLIACATIALNWRKYTWRHSKIVFTVSIMAMLVCCSFFFFENGYETIRKWGGAFVLVGFVNWFLSSRRKRL